MKTCIIILLMVTPCLRPVAQCLVTYQDFNNFVYVFDAGEGKYIENQPLRSYKIGRNDIMAYIAENGRLKLYYKGKVTTLLDYAPNYYMTENWFLYQNFNVVKVLYKDSFMLLENLFTPGSDSLYYSDSVIVWSNQHGEINAFYGGQTYLLERSPIHRAKIGPNIFVYADINGNFKVFYRGQLQTLETYEPANYALDQDMLMYTDQYDNYKFFHDGELSETNDANTFKEYRVGKDFAVFLSTVREFTVYYKGEETVLMDDKPVRYTAHKNMLVYTDKGNNFWCWYQGKKYWLERYTPLSYKVDDNIVVYQDLDGRLKAFYYGEQVDVSDQIVDKYSLINEAVTYSIQPYETKIWCNKKTYTFK